MVFVVVYDACVLFPAPLRDLLVRLAQTGVVRAKWSEQILDEVFRNVLRVRPDLKPEQLERTRKSLKSPPRTTLELIETLVDERRRGDLSPTRQEFTGCAEHVA